MNRFCRLKIAALAGTSMLAFGIAGAAGQTVTDYAYTVGDTTPSAAALTAGTYVLSGFNNQQHGASASAVTTSLTIGVDGLVDDVTLTVSANEIDSIANGNSGVTAAADDLQQQEGWGLRTLSSQLASDGATVRAEAGSAGIGAELDLFEVGNVAIDGNAIRAAATVNDATSLVQGIPSATAASPAGTVTGGLANGVVAFSVEDAHSSLSSVQIVSDAGPDSGSGAQIEDVSIYVRDAAPAASVEAALSVGDNEIAATYVGNRASNAISDPDGTDHAGSASLVNLQANFQSGAHGGAIAAGVSAASVSVDVSAEIFSGTASVHDNAIQADVAGNSAANQLVTSETIRLSGSGTPGSASLGQASATFGTALAADFGLASVQVNAGAELRADVSHEPGLYGGIGAGIEATFSGATVAVRENEVVARSTGNAASSLLAAEGSGIEASFVASNLQINEETVVSASVTRMAVGVTTESSNLLNSTITTSDNAIGAEAAGSSAVTQLVVSGESLDLGSEVTTASASSPSSASIAGAGAAILNLQSGQGDSGAVSATVSDALIGLFRLSDVGNGTLGVSDNSVHAGASGNLAANRLQLDGLVGSGSAGIGNLQVNEVAVIAAAQATGITVFPVGNLDEAVVSLSGNEMSAVALGNSGSNSVSASGFSVLGLGKVNSAYASSADTGAGSAALAIVSNQMSDADIAASVGGGAFISVELAEMRSGIAAVSDNLMLASATGNLIANTLGVDAVNLAAAGPESGEALTGEGYAYLLQNLQTASGGSITAALNGVQANLTGDAASGSTLSVSGNRQVAQARSNVALNQVGFGGLAEMQSGALLSSSQASLATVNAMVTGGQGLIDVTTTDGSTQAAQDLSLQALGAGNVAENAMNVTALNMRSDGSAVSGAGYQVLNGQMNGGTVSATVSEGQIGIGHYTDRQALSGGIASVLNNGMSALASGNSSDNRLTLAAASSFGVSGGVSNTQVNGGAISARVSAATVGIFTSSADTATLAVTGNSIRASATGNSSVNVVRRTN